MAEIHADGGPLPPFPDDLTIAQFIMDTHHPLRPVRDRLRPWLIEEDTGREVGSDELRTRTFGLANALKTRWNIGEDDVVCLFSPNHIDRASNPHRAVHKLGAIVTTANPSFTRDEITYQLQLTKSCMVFAHSTNLSIALEAARAVGIPVDRVIVLDSAPNHKDTPSVQVLVVEGLREVQNFSERRLEQGEAKRKLAFLLFSSGTTGKPKAVMITHYAVIANLVQNGQYMQLTGDKIPPQDLIFRPESVVLLVSYIPYLDAYGLLFVLFSGLAYGATILVSQGFQLERALNSIERYRVTHLCFVPPMAVLLCKSPVVRDYDLSSVRYFFVGAAPVSVELTDQLVRVLPKTCKIGQGYGMTETATMISFMRLDLRVGTPGSAGVLLPGYAARVVKQDGTLAGFNEPGELHLKGPSLALGYLNNPQATAETFKDGWLATGDEVIINERKEIFISDRIKELIKVRAFQVAPAELEGLLLNHPDVADVCVVGIPDPYSGELPLAFAVPTPDARTRVERNAEERAKVKAGIMEYVAKHKVYYKRLAGVEFVHTIPKNPSGKLLRRILRDKARNMLASGELTVASKAKL
ncbi:acetyl-CoA synthetase-like protein [Trametes sanguinea]|nr:acetyl-CoA synthetase-like protein [Trametes sanguinea]